VVTRHSPCSKHARVRWLAIDTNSPATVLPTTLFRKLARDVRQKLGMQWLSKRHRAIFDLDHYVVSFAPSGNAFPSSVRINLPGPRVNSPACRTERHGLLVPQRVISGWFAKLPGLVVQIESQRGN
jgi:hypothetical protein